MNPLIRYPIYGVCKLVVWAFLATLLVLIYILCAFLTIIEAAWQNEPIRVVWKRQTAGLR